MIFSYKSINFFYMVFEFPRLGRVLDYSGKNTHMLVRTRDDGLVHMWDMTGHSPKVIL